MDIDKAAIELEIEVRALYEQETAEDVVRWGNDTVPDFLEYNGMRVQKFGILLHQLCRCDACTRSYARDIVDQLLIFEHGLIRGAGGSGDCEQVSRWFLENHELPSVFPLVPAPLRKDPAAFEAAQIPDEALDQLRVRHIFGIKHP